MFARDLQGQGQAQTGAFSTARDQWQENLFLQIFGHTAAVVGDFDTDGQTRQTVGDLHLTMPISIRTEDDGVGGNHITLARFDVPAGIADPAERISETRERTNKVRNERSTPYVQIIAGAMNLMPRWYIGSMLRKVDFLASDVPGLPVPVYLAGAKMRVQYAFGPTIGAAVNVTLLTYCDTCSLGIDVDTGAIPDFEEFYDCLVEGFDEVLALAG